MKSKKAWLDKLFYDIGNQKYDFFLCGTYIKNGEKYFTKWKKYSECIFPIDYDGTAEDWKTQKFFEQINQRQILPNEIVLDLEEKESLPEIVKKLKQGKFRFYVFSTGSRGYHIHLYTKHELTPEKKLAVIKYFGADTQKNSEKTMIALEYSPHWKSGKIKEEVTNERYRN